MKAIAAFLLISLITLPYPVAHFALKMQKYKVRKQVKWNLIHHTPEEELITLSFLTDEVDQKVRWEHSREFEYDGEMYDIVSSSIVGDSIRYVVWWDHEETELNRKLDKLTESAMDGENRNAHRIRIHLLTYERGEDPQVPKQILVPASPPTFHYFRPPYSTIVEPLTPPPRG